MDIKNLNIAIVGAGYAGAAAAKALSNLGADVTVYEQASAIGEVGAGIGLRPSSMDQFNKWGIGEAIKAVTSPSDAFEILGADTTPIAIMEWPEKEQYGETTNFIHRGDFIDALIGTLPEGMVKVGYKLESITDNTADGGKVELTFANGETVSADLVIGADGINSVVRNKLFSTEGPVFAGEHAYRVVIDEAETFGLVADGNLRMYIGRGTKVYLLPLKHRGQVSFDITALNADSTWAPQHGLAEILATVEGFDERIIKITEGLDISKVNIRAVYDINPVDEWHTNGVALIGDAAHAMCHHQGQGANSAILDAGAIADALAEAESIPAALAAYKAARKPITDELQKISRQGWTDEEVNDVFPGQHPGDIASTISAPTEA